VLPCAGTGSIRIGVESGRKRMEKDGNQKLKIYEDPKQMHESC
jgi:hypothetical protein